MMQRAEAATQPPFAKQRAEAEAIGTWVQKSEAAAPNVGQENWAVRSHESQEMKTRTREEDTAWDKNEGGSKSSLDCVAEEDRSRSEASAQERLSVEKKLLEFAAWKREEERRRQESIEASLKLEEERIAIEQERRRMDLLAERLVEELKQLESRNKRAEDARGENALQLSEATSCGNIRIKDAEERLFEAAPEATQRDEVPRPSGLRNERRETHAVVTEREVLQRNIESWVPSSYSKSPSSAPASDRMQTGVSACIAAEYSQRNVAPAASAGTATGVKAVSSPPLTPGTSGYLPVAFSHYGLVSSACDGGMHERAWVSKPCWCDCASAKYSRIPFQETQRTRFSPDLCKV